MDFIFYNIYKILPEGYWDFLIILFGLCIGSFINVCIYRMPRGTSIIYTPSQCTNCGKKIKFYENIPVLSWFFLRGKCSYCKTKISSKYVFIEIITAILIFFMWLKAKEGHFPLSALIINTNLIVLLVVTFFVDLKYYIIPNPLVYTTGILGIIFHILFPYFFNKPDWSLSLLSSLEGLAAAGLIPALFLLFGQFTFKKEVFGWGDVKIMASIGACTGFYSLAWLFILFIASSLGAISGIILILVGKKRLTNKIPFGPFISFALCLWILFGTELVQMYLNLIKDFIH